MASSLLFVARAWSQLIAVILLLVAGRFLNINDFGEFTLAAAVALMLNQFMGIGTYEYVIRNAGERNAPTTAFWVNVLLAIAYILIGGLIALASGKVFRSERVMVLVMLMIPLSLPAGARSVAESVLVRDGRIGQLAITSIAVESLALAVGVGGLMTGWGVYSLVASRYVQSGISAFIFLAVARWLPAIEYSKLQAREMMHLWRSMIVDRGLSYFQNYGADLLLGAFMTPAAVAIYRIGARIVALVTTIVYEPMRTINWRILSLLHARHGAIQDSTELIIGCVYLVLVGPIVLLGLTGGDLATIALGNQWHETGMAIMLLCAAALLALPQQLSEPAFGVAGAIKQLPLQRGITLLVSLGLLLALARFGPVGAAASQMVAAAISFIVTAVMQNRVLGIHPRNYLRNMAYALLAGLVAGGAAELVAHFTMTLSMRLRLPLMIVAGVAVYGVIILGLRRRPLLQVLALAGEKV
ncbi:MAG: oligosaccharide flippase family protein [Caulobacteraceae bacterium]|nr:oligosaccharide flippase family protein [Caulobacteraceae bacterium]